MTLDEPAVTLTDGLLAVAALAWALRFLGRPQTRLFAIAFAAVALGSAFGGAWHGFHSWQPDLRDALWRASLAALGGAGSAFALAATRSFAGPRVFRAVAGLVALDLALWLVWITRHDAFVWVSVQLAPALLWVGWLALRDVRAGGRAGGWIVAGVAVSIVAGVVQALGPDLAESFDRNALFHALELGGLALLARGVGRLPEQASRVAARSPR